MVQQSLEVFSFANFWMKVQHNPFQYVMH